MSPRHLLTLRPRMPEGTGRISAKITDPSGRKTGLLDRIRGKRPSGEARARFSRRPEECALSDLVFAWALQERESSPNSSPRRRLRPNPQHYVGLFQTSLLVYLEYRGDPTSLAFEIQTSQDRQIVASGTEATGRGDESSHWRERGRLPRLCRVALAA